MDYTFHFHGVDSVLMTDISGHKCAPHVFWVIFLKFPFHIALNLPPRFETWQAEFKGKGGDSNMGIEHRGKVVVFNHQLTLVKMIDNSIFNLLQDDCIYIHSGAPRLR